MTDEHKLHQDKLKAAQAKAERGGKLIDGFLTQAKRECHDVFAQSMPADSQVREDAYWLLKALEQIEAAYARTVNAGKVAEHELLQLQKEQGK